MTDDIMTTCSFDDELHQLLNTPRPKKDNETGEIQRLLKQLCQTCSGENKTRWKRLVLSLVHKRYHMLSPEAQAIRRQRTDDETEEDKTCSTGEGERKIFYLAIQSLFRKALTHPENAEDEAKAYECLLKIAPVAGGSRDVCTILEDSISIALLEREPNTQHATTSIMGEKEPEKSLVIQVGNGVRSLTERFQHDSDANSSVYKHLEGLLQLTADTLDQDLDLVREQGTNATTKKNIGKEDYAKQMFPSTLHVFIPHRDRARVSGKKRKTDDDIGPPDRQVINSVAEILIWSRTNAAMSQNAFSQSYETFLRVDNNTTDKETAQKALHTMQTIVRKLRKQLNDYARNQGFMLTDQYRINPTALNLGKVGKGKAGDLSILTKRAKKHESARVLKLIHHRFTSSSNRVTKFASINEICQHGCWIPANFNKDDEVEVLERNIQLARFKATLTHLRKVLNRKDEEDDNSKHPRAVVTSMDNASSNDVAAILVAAAMGSWEIEEQSEDSKPSSMETEDDGTSGAIAAPKANELKPKLFIGGIERRLDSFQDCMQIMDQVMEGSEKNQNNAPSFMDESGVSTTKAVMNMIERNVADGDTLLLITSADIRLPEDVMKGLTARGCSVHCHDADDIGERLRREEASRGDITISLAWDTHDDLDLHVTIPSKEHLFFSNTISKDSNCRLDVDMNAFSPFSSEPVENVFCGNLKTRKEAPRGRYMVVVQNYGYHTKDEKAAIPFRVMVEKNGQRQRFAGECKGSGDSSNVVVCEFDYKGRTVPFPSDDDAYKAAFASSRVVNLTSSTGQNLEALANLVQILKQHKHLDKARQLIDDEQVEKDVASTNDDEMMAARPLVAHEGGTLEVTSRDRQDILLAKLPKRFHLIVGEVFGGPTLAEECAQGIARRMMADKIPLSELQRAGYPAVIIDGVKQELASCGAANMS